MKKQFLAILLTTAIAVFANAQIAPANFPYGIRLPNTTQAESAKIPLIDDEGIVNTHFPFSAFLRSDVSDTLSGNLIADKFIKSGASALDILLGDGSTIQTTNFVKITGDLYGISGTKMFTDLRVEDEIGFKPTGLATHKFTGYGSIGHTTDGKFWFWPETISNPGLLDFTNLTGSRTFLFPDKNGTVVVDSDLTNIDAETLDGLDSSQFLRSDTSDTMDGDLSITGNVGIGTDAPLYKLDVRDPNYDQIHAGSYDGGATFGSNNIGQFIISGGRKSDGTYSSTHATKIMGFDGMIYFYTVSGVTAGDAFNPSLRMLLDDDGKLGIGTSSPSYRLDVAGNGRFTGNVTANSFIKSGATSDDVLLGDGSTTSKASLGRPYDVYTALLTQSGTSAPTATVLENTTGRTITWSRTGTGQYRGTISGSSLAANKVYIYLQQPYAFPRKFSSIVLSGGSTILLDTTDGVSTLADSHLTNTSLEIRIYP